MIAKVQQTIEQLHMFEDKDTVVVGVSGGADSVCLLLNLLEYQRMHHINIEVVHVNHMIREDAPLDAEFVRELCNRNNVIFHLYNIDVIKMAKEKHLTVEEAGRNARYAAYREVLGSRCGKIALGHHRDDLAETVMYNICRGSGLHGLVGIMPINNDIVRPLIYVSREEIESYLLNLSQTYCTDSTNLSTEYTRNKMRLKVLPYLEKEIHEGTREHIADMAADICQLEEYLNLQIEDALRDAYISENTYNIEVILKYPRFLRGEIILKAIRNLHNGRKDITRKHVEQILDSLDKNGEKRTILPYNIEVVKSYDSLIFRYCEAVNATKNCEAIAISLSDIQPEMNIKFDDTDITFRLFDANMCEVISENPYTKWLDYDKIECQLEVRHRTPGDYLCINEKMQRKSIKEYFIDEKIPAGERAKVALVADGDHIIWVIGHRISEYYKVTRDTKRIVEITLK
ncbi:MAG: tRNA lysidine(34) synthetase TilS [Lachnospiraceae bacterium]|nr:tRNA lysidine(34) synthetase TilS [Candidatus Colinaster equi]